MHIPFEVRQRIKNDIMRRESGILSVTIKEHEIYVIVSEKSPLPADRAVVIDGHSVPINYEHGSIYSLASPAVMQVMEAQMEQIQAAADNPSCRVCQFDTIRGGISIGHRRVTAGTLGTFVYFKEDSKWGILSNNHVMANVNDCAVGDEIVQPGVFDASTVFPKPIARLERWINLKFLRSECDPITPLNVNYIDCALARPLPTIPKTRNIIDVGFPQGVRNPSVGLAVRKSGRTTKTNSDFIKSTDVMIKVNYGTEQSPRFCGFDDIISTGPIIKGGDSGSLLCDLQGNAVGLVFAASFDASMNPISGYACRIDRVLEAMNCTMLRLPPNLDPVGDVLQKTAAGMFMGSIGGFAG